MKRFLMFLLVLAFINISIYAPENVVQNEENHSTPENVVQNEENHSASENVVQNEENHSASEYVDFVNTSTPPIFEKYPSLWVTPAVSPQKTDQKTIYLTFDDGPSKRTNEILDILNQYGIKATFFVTCQVEYQKNEDHNEILRRIVNEGHSIGVHTYSHKYKEIYSSVDAFLLDFNKIFYHIQNITDVTPSIYRFPGGSYNAYNKNVRDDIIKEMSSRGFEFYDWNVSADDSIKKIDAYQIKQNVTSTIAKKIRAFVLMHDSYTQSSTVEALEDIIIWGIMNDYEFDKITSEVSPIHFK